METVPTFGEDAKRSHQTAALFYADTPGPFDETNCDSNDGLRLHHGRAGLSKEIDMMGRLHSDIFTQHQYMFNGVDIKVKLTPTKDVFSLIASDDTIAYMLILPLSIRLWWSGRRK